MLIPDHLLRKLDTPGPRYTSYPTADRFHDGFGATAYTQALQQRGASGGNTPLSVYVHVPFCASVCYYCGCNKIVTRHHEQAVAYLKLLETEIALHRAALGAAQPISQLHFGGGTPTFLTDAELAELMAMLDTAFVRVPGAEVSIEVDPRTATPERLQSLWEMGFNRLSFGVQDFDPAVQEAVHRVQPYEMVRELVHASRAIGFESINADLIYGLPKQTPQSFARTVEQVCALRPDRIALYAYAHLPERFKPQRRIDGNFLPMPAERLQMLGGAIDGFLGQGYSYIGMDHFALPSDSLAVAQRQGRLHRNFQGYSTQPDCDMIGLGVSAIGRVGATYSQNAKTLTEYETALKDGVLPVVRGLALRADDELRRDVIMAIMCQGRVDFATIEAAHGIDFATTFANELEQLQGLEELGVVMREKGALQVTPLGWWVVRGVAMVFDAHLQANRGATQFSRVI